LPVDFDEYRRFSRLFKAAISAITPLVEDRGIDEVFADVTEVGGDSPSVGRRIKDAVAAATSLTCSVGIAPNKLLAKICSDLEKPDGLTLLSADDLQGRIWPLPARRINGIGPKAGHRLASMGIHTIGDLAACDAALLLRHFGPNYGRWLHEAAHGRDDRPVVTESEPRSRSRETTFERDLHPQADRAELGRIFTRLCEAVAADLVRRGLVGRTIGIKLRFDDFSTVTRDQTLAEPTADALLIRRTAGACLKRVVLDRRLRLLGVRVSSLARREDVDAALSEGATLPLFEG
ncbi:MAG: DNA polymerase IV, partial [Rhodocyclaceae bacterium]|nr:DNA polymerase IV [Rhodocyclaceae bacterium]